MLIGFWTRAAGLAAALLLGGFALGVAPAVAAETAIEKTLAFPFSSDLKAAERADRVAWIRLVKGVRNVWVASGPDWIPRQVTQFTEDDGVELTQPTFSPDGATLLFVRGGDHDGNWEAPVLPNPTSSPVAPKVEIWKADPTGKTPASKLVDGDGPSISARGQIAYLVRGEVWTVGPDGKDAHRLFYDRGHDGSIAWSPDGSRLAFVSNRDDHSFIGVYADQRTPILWLAPSTGLDGDPVWSPNGRRVAFTRRPGAGGPPASLLKEEPQPWAIWTADVATGAAERVWKSAGTLRGSYPDVVNGANLRWAGDDRLTFLYQIDNWQHLYVVPISGGEARLLTPGPFMVEHTAATRDGRTLVYSANTGQTAYDGERRHLFKVSVDGGAPKPLTSGEGLEWSPAVTADAVAFIGADARRPPAVERVSLSTGRRDRLGDADAESYAPATPFVIPRDVTWTAPDGLTIHGQLFETSGGPAKKPAVIFVHGGPPRQMMLGWSYMRYYSNAYAMNQFLAANGFVVLSVNYRLGIGYGFDFAHPEKAGWAGSSEYQDVLAAAQWLKARPGVNPDRIGIWGGSYGGLLTALALARNSEVFKAGVDLHGVHDWSRAIGYGGVSASLARYEKGDFDLALETAFKASPVADVDRWTSPVLLIHGDDDRNVRINQTVDLARRLERQGVPFEEMILPDELHDFLLYRNWVKADSATVDFLSRTLKAR